MRYSCLYRRGGRDNGRPSMVFGSVHSFMFIAWHFETSPLLAREKETFWNLFCPCAPYCSQVSFIGGEEEERRKKMTILNFFKIRFLGFHKTELKSEVLRRVRAFSRYPFSLSFHALSPLPIVLSKHFNHPYPYIEIATAISDKHRCFPICTCMYMYVYFYAALV